MLDTFGSSGKESGQFQLGHDITIAHDGSGYVAEGTGQRVQKCVRKPHYAKVFMPLCCPVRPGIRYLVCCYSAHSRFVVTSETLSVIIQEVIS